MLTNATKNNTHNLFDIEDCTEKETSFSNNDGKNARKSFSHQMLRARNQQHEPFIEANTSTLLPIHCLLKRIEFLNRFIRSHQREAGRLIEDNSHFWCTILPESLVDFKRKTALAVMILLVPLMKMTLKMFGRTSVETCTICSHSRLMALHVSETSCVFQISTKKRCDATFRFNKQCYFCYFIVGFCVLFC